ncbi:MAG: STAS domain-containing protein [Cytophagales bacterium]
MTIQTKIDSNDAYLMIQGEVDASCSIELDNEISKVLSVGVKNILIDCAELTYISSAGLGVFMAHYEDCNDAGVKMVVYNMSAKIKSVFGMLGLDQILPIKDTEEEAKHSINA